MPYDEKPFPNDKANSQGDNPRQAFGAHGVLVHNAAQAPVAAPLSKLEGSASGVLPLQLFVACASNYLLCASWPNVYVAYRHAD